MKDISFENYCNLPEEVQDIINQFDEDGELYQECEKMLKKLEPLGYSFEYGLDGEPYNLHKI